MPWNHAASVEQNLCDILYEIWPMDGGSLDINILVNIFSPVMELIA